MVEPVVNEEKLRELLALETEYTTLDFKKACDLKKQRDRVEIAKDVGAMSVHGGFIIIGVDGRGRPVDNLTPEQAMRFDEARLRPQLLKWLPESLELHSQTHEVNGILVVLIYISPNPAGCAFFHADGQYQRDDGEVETVFRSGDVFFRDGTQSRRLGQGGFELVIDRRLQTERRRWEIEHAAEYERLAKEQQVDALGRRIAHGPSTDFNLALDLETLTEAALELLRSADDIPLRRVLNSAPRDAAALYEEGHNDEFGQLLDRLTCLAATFLEFERPEWFERSVKTMLTIYGLPFDRSPVIPDHPPPEAAELWLKVIDRIVGLGSMAVRLNQWRAVRVLAAQRDPRMHRIYVSWIRHALTMASRASLFESYQGTDDIKLSLLSLARETVRRLTCLHTDVAANDERVIDGLARFDFLACLISISETDNSRTDVFYPNFARFDSGRAQPIAEQVLEDEEMRKIIFPHSNRDLALAFSVIDHQARREALRYDGWDGYTDPVERFVKEHAPRET